MGYCATSKRVPTLAPVHVVRLSLGREQTCSAFTDNDYGGDDETRETEWTRLRILVTRARLWKGQRP